MSPILLVLKTSRLVTFPLLMVVLSVELCNAILGINTPLFVDTTSICAESSGKTVPTPTWALA